MVFQAVQMMLERAALALVRRRAMDSGAEDMIWNGIEVLGGSEDCQRAIEALALADGGAPSGGRALRRYLKSIVVVGRSRSDPLPLLGVYLVDTSEIRQCSLAWIAGRFAYGAKFSELYACRRVLAPPVLRRRHAEVKIAALTAQKKMLLDLGADSREVAAVEDAMGLVRDCARQRGHRR